MPLPSAISLYFRPEGAVMVCSPSSLDWQSSSHIILLFSSGSPAACASCGLQVISGIPQKHIGKCSSNQIEAWFVLQCVKCACIAWHVHGKQRHQARLA